MGWGLIALCAVIVLIAVYEIFISPWAALPCFALCGGVAMWLGRFVYGELVKDQKRDLL